MLDLLRVNQEKSLVVEDLQHPGRMDAYAPTLIKLGLRSMIGKGYRLQSVKDAIVENNGIYFGAIGGAGALMSNCIKKCEIIAFDDLGPEAIRD